MSLSQMVVGVSYHVGGCKCWNLSRMVVGVSYHASECECCVMCIWAVLRVTMKQFEDDEVTVGYTGVARHVISPGILLQVLQWHIISLGRSCRFYKRHIIILEMYLLDGLLREMINT